MSVHTKQCISCREQVPLSGFSKTANGGLARRCDDCRYTAVPHLDADGNEVKRCSKCRDVLPLGHFHKVSKKGCGYASKCRTCASAAWAARPGRPRKGRKPYEEPDFKVCTRCKSELPIEEFAPRTERKNGRRPSCRQCQSELHRQWRERNPGASRDRNLQAKYGITNDDYLEILDAQGGVCGICGREDSGTTLTPFLYVDHDHDSNDVRGLLCHFCNVVVGHIEKDVRTSSALRRLDRQEQGPMTAASSSVSVPGPGMGGHHRPNSGVTDTWLTPPEILDALGPFDLDPCVAPSMPWTTATWMLTEADDGLASAWGPDEFVWLNPPYGQATWAWLSKLAAHPAGGIALIFARTETRGFFTEVWAKADALLFIEGRLFFHHEDGSRARSNSGAPSVLVGYGREACRRLRQASRSHTVSGVFVPVADTEVEVS